MNKKELDFILQEGEGLKLEFKENLSNLDKEIVAYANSEGGRIFLGVSDKGKVNGIQITNKLKSEIQDIANNCDPKIKIKLEEFRFKKNPGGLFLTSKVICATYQDNEKVKILDKKEFDNGIIENIKETVNYVKRHINTEYIIRKLEREEILQYPEEAIREAIVNAIMHRDYFDNSGDVLIEIFRNKLVISNPGGLVKSLKPEFFGKVSRTRNPVIANLLARTEYVEKLGTGIDRIKNAMKKARLLAPVFEFNSSFFITLYDRTFSVKSSVKILSLIKENPQITIPEIAENISLTTRAVDKNISHLKKQGILKRIGGKKGGYWKIKNLK